MTAWAFAVVVCVTVHGRDYCSPLRDQLYTAEETCDRARAGLEALFNEKAMVFSCVREKRKMSARRRQPREPAADARRL